MNVLITGGTGFAGKNLVDFFYKCGYGVTATYRSAAPQCCITGVRYVKQDLSQYIEIDGQFDAIIHTAVSHSGEELPITEYVRDNIDTARQIVDFARRSGIGTIIYFSTRSIYGEIRTAEVGETGDIINPGKYGVTKYIAELIFQEAKDIHTFGMRFPGIIGSGAHDIWLVDIVNKIAQGLEVEISDFDTRNLVHIDDVAIFIKKLLLLRASGRKFKYSCVNLCCDETINNIEIAGIIKKRLHSQSVLKVKPPGEGLFHLKSDQAKEMGFISSSPRDIVNRYLDFYIQERKIFGSD